MSTGVIGVRGDDDRSLHSVTTRGRCPARNDEARFAGVSVPI